MVDFGWSYPPGCSSVPGDEDIACEICGHSEYTCECEECPECGEIGNPLCYQEHGMVDEKPVKSIEDICNIVVGCPDFHVLEKAIYKGTSCGAWLESIDGDGRDNWMGGIAVGSIVEGSDRYAERREIYFPCTIDDFWNAVQDVEEDAERIWNDTHGCEKCWDHPVISEWGTPRHFGDWPINPECPHCGGHGTIL